ncbi:hypothetical protein NC652_007912 [Populus alba x Populus x berolinensis]|nr:hypothetical protein NC652_007912 [Populus alba x Populus x berolinensis]
MIMELCTKWKIKHSNSSPYRPKMNGAVKAANKNIKKIIQKKVVTYRDWHEMLSFALHAYRTTVRSSTGTTPYSLVYGMEAVMPLELEIPSLRVLMDFELEEADKWAPNYEGPYVVKKAFSGGALKLARMDGEDLARAVNSDSEDREEEDDLDPPVLPPFLVAPRGPTRRHCFRALFLRIPEALGCFRGGGKTKGERRLLGFCRVWPEEMEKRSVVARNHWSCCGGGRRNESLWGWSSVSVGGGCRPREKKALLMVVGRLKGRGDVCEGCSGVLGKNEGSAERGDSEGLWLSFLVKGETKIFQPGKGVAEKERGKKWPRGREAQKEDGGTVCRRSGENAEEPQWRKINDEYNDEEVELTKEETKLIRRVLKGKAPHGDFDPYAPYIDWFKWEDSKHPLSNAPEPKAPFVYWKVVFFWKVNSGESEFQESIFRCLVV